MQDPARGKDWVYSPGRVGLSGISAGGFVAGHAAVRLAKAGRLPSFLAMLNPMIDPKMERPSYQHFGDLPSCPTAFLRYCWQALLEESPGKPPSSQRLLEASLPHADWSACKGLRVMNVTGRYELFYDDGLELNKTIQAAELKLEPIIAQGSHALCLVLDADASQKRTAWFAACMQA